MGMGMHGYGYGMGMRAMGNGPWTIGQPMGHGFEYGTS